MHENLGIPPKKTGLIIPPPETTKSKEEEEKKKRINEIVALRPKLVGFCLLFLKKEKDARSLAEEFAQEAIMKAINKVDSFRQEAKLSSWVMSIARNLMLSYLRDKRRDIQANAIPELSENINADSDLNLSVDHTEDSLNLKIDYKKLKSQLTPEELKIVELREQGFSFKEIGEMLSILPQTIKSRMSRMYERFRHLGDSK